MADPLVLDAPAKLNLFLEVTGRRPDGYHLLDSVFQAIDLCDTVELARADRISLSVEGGSAPSGPANLAWRAAERLGVGASIRLVKRIPAGAGLGGGSSDAAAVLRGLNRLYGLKLPAEELRRHAVALGADVPFFLAGGLARCRGIGDEVEPLPDPPARRFLLVLPALETSTAAVYAALDAGLTGNRLSATVYVRDYLDSGKWGRAPRFNRLQAVAEALDPRLGGVREAAERRLGVRLTLTGSGSAYFAPAESVVVPGTAFTTRDGIDVVTKAVASAGRR